MVIDSGCGGRDLARRTAMRLEGKTAIIIGAGQNPGETVGNGRATALRFAQEGAKIMSVDRNLASAGSPTPSPRPSSSSGLP